MIGDEMAQDRYIKAIQRKITMLQAEAMEIPRDDDDPKIQCQRQVVVAEIKAYSDALKIYRMVNTPVYQLKALTA